MQSFKISKIDNLSVRVLGERQPGMDIRLDVTIALDDHVNINGRVITRPRLNEKVMSKGPGGYLFIITKKDTANQLEHKLSLRSTGTFINSISLSLDDEFIIYEQYTAEGI